MWLLLLVSGWEVVTSIMIFSGYCFWSVWFALWCKSIFFDLFWNVKFFIAAKLKGFRLFKVPPGSQWKAIFSVSLVCRSKFRRMDCSLNWSFINYGELCWDSFMIAPAYESYQTWIFIYTAEISSFCRSRSAGSRIAKTSFPHVPRSQGRSSVPSLTSLCAENFINTFVEQKLSWIPYSSEWQKQPTIEKCWYNLSNLTNQGVYQELVYRNHPRRPRVR